MTSSTPASGKPNDPASKESPRGVPSSVATRLAHFALERAELWHDQNGRTYSTFSVGGHRETARLQGQRFRQWLNGLCWDQDKKSPPTKSVDDAIRQLESFATFNGRCYKPFVRVGEDGNKVYIDLGNDDWQAVEIDAEGWRVVNNPPVRFLRHSGMMALPTPARGGDFRELRRFVNVASDSDFLLLVAWIIACFRPRGPYPVLIIEGEPGSSKSTLARIVRAIADPNSSPLRSEPSGIRDLMIAATHNWLLCLDNLSGISPWLADALCRLATGGGFSTRVLYSDDDEVIIEASRPVILTGIDSLTNRDDLRDRAIVLNLEPIPGLSPGTWCKKQTVTL